MISYHLDNLAGLAPLYCQYDGQSQPQPAYIQLAEDGTVSADYSGEIGNGVPMRVWHNIDLRWRVDGRVKADVLRDLLTDTLAADLASVHAGHDVDYHRDSANRTGRLSDEAQEASDRIEAALRDLDPDDLDQVWSAGDWIANAHISDLVEPGESVADAAVRLTEEARAEGVLLDGDLEAEIADRIEREADN